jgi:cyclomaltodextrinase / maltogenic alpha-amylase / neopullulanase
VHARTSVEHVTNTTLALRSTPRDGGAGLVLLLSVDEQPQRFPDELAGEVVESATPAGDPLEVPPHSWRVLSS